MALRVIVWGTGNVLLRGLIIAVAVGGLVTLLAV